MNIKDHFIEKGYIFINIFAIAWIIVGILLLIAGLLTVGFSSILVNLAVIGTGTLILLANSIVMFLLVVCSGHRI